MEHIEETFTFYRLPRQDKKHIKSMNMLERLNGDRQQRTGDSGSSQTRPASYGYCGYWLWRPTSAGWRRTAT